MVDRADPEQNPSPHPSKRSALRHYFSLPQLRELGLRGVVSYLSAAALSIIVAHVLSVGWPQSVWSERLTAPITKGIEFLDTHWKSILILVTPFALPTIRGLIPRLRKAGGFEFDPVPLISEGVREKPVPMPPGDAK
jgi:hypothetical protein